MIRKNLVLDDYTYIVDLYQHGVDDVGVYKNYYILRSFELYNTEIFESDIYFVEREIIDNFKRDFIDNNLLQVQYGDNSNNLRNNIIYPDVNNNFSNFSDNKKDFYKISNERLNEYDIYKYNENNYVNDVLYKNDKLAEIPCDEVRLYHPHNKVELSGIIHVHNFINNIHFHYFCRNMYDFESYGGQEFESHNILYNEYIKFYIPNLTELFKEENKYYIKENIQKIDDIHNYLFLSKLIKPYKLLFTDGEISGRDYNLNLPTNNNSSITLTIFPTDGYNNTLDLYNLDTYYRISSCTFFQNIKFKLNSQLGFNEDGILSVINRFSYKNFKNFESVNDAYNFYYGKIAYEDEIVKAAAKERYDTSDELLSDTEREFEQVIYLGYKFYIATDMLFKNIVFQTTYQDKNNIVDDFNITLDQIFTSWDQYPDLLICKVIFIDNYRGNAISSNPVPIIKEYFKYLINDSSYNIKKIDFNKINNSEDMNFVNKINCYVTKKDEDLSLDKKITGVKVIYKPIFYKVGDLQTISLQRNLTQNIGIYLTNYMTKVETFKISLEGVVFNEIGRNEVYVIFQINSSIIPDMNGSYHILDQDDNYISSGKYMIG